MADGMKTELVSAIHLQEVELQDEPADKEQGSSNNNSESPINNQYLVETSEMNMGGWKTRVDDSVLPPTTRWQQNLSEPLKQSDAELLFFY